MLCSTCPKRPVCQSACDELKRDLARIERPQLESVKSPEQIAGIELRHALRTFFGTEPDLRENRPQPTDSIPVANHERLHLALEGLTKRQRECLKLYYWEGLSKKAIAEKLNLSRPTVIQHLDAAVKALRETFPHAKPTTTYTPAHRGERDSFFEVGAI